MYRITRLITVIAFLFIAAAGHSQDKLIDSLKIELKNPKLHDTTRLRKIALFRDQNYTNADKGYYYLFDMLGEIAEKNYKNKKSNSPELQKKYTMWMGSYYGSMAVRNFNGDQKKALDYFDKSIAMHNESGRQKDMYFAMVSRASLLVQMKEYDRAIPDVFKAIKYFEANKKSVPGENFAYAYTALAYIYAKQNKHSEAIDFYKKVLNCYKDYYPNKYVKYQMGKTHSLMAGSYKALKDYPESIAHSEKALELAKPMNDKYQTVVDLCSIGLVKMEQSKFDEAEEMFNKALALQAPDGKETNDRAFISANLSMASLNLKKGDFSMATSYAEKGLAVSQKYKEKSYISEASKMLYKISLEKKDFERALKMFQLDQKVGDSLRMESSKNALAQQLLQYNFEKKELQQKIIQEKKVAELKLKSEKEKAEQESENKLAQQQLTYDFEKKALNQKIDQQKKVSAVKIDAQKVKLDAQKAKLDAQKKTAAKNNWLIGLSGVLLLVLLGLYFYYRNNKQKQAITVLEKDQIKQKLLVSQMNPHFIFNSIENIQQLIYDNKDTDAVNYLSKFSVLTRQILENSNENYISLSEEVAMIGNYLSIQQLLYSNKFDFTIAVEETVDAEAIFLPPMLTQPFIENAIKHGLAAKDTNGMVDIRFYLNEGKLFFEVLDNGKGFDASKRTDNHKSLAMVITKERLVSYTKNQDFVVQADNIKDKNEKVVGAKVVFEIPYIYEN